MDDLLIRSRMIQPVTTGLPTPQTHGTDNKTAVTGHGTSAFQQALEQASRNVELSFSKHAAGRLEQREITLSPGGLEKLSQGVELARDKGLDDALILMDGSAFIVSAKNSTVITALNGRELNGKVITNIDGTVIL